MEAVKIMKQHKIWRLAVVRVGNLRGVVTAADIARNLESYLDSEIRDTLSDLRSPRYSPEGRLTRTSGRSQTKARGISS